MGHEKGNGGVDHLALLRLARYGRLSIAGLGAIPATLGMIATVDHQPLGCGRQEATTRFNAIQPKIFCAIS